MDEPSRLKPRPWLRVLARTRRVATATPALARLIARRHPPIAVSGRHRLLPVGSVARRPSARVVPVVPPAAEGFSDFAKAWLFGTGEAEGVPFDSAAAQAHLATPTVVPDAVERTAAPAPVRPEASSLARRAAVEEVSAARPFRLSRVPAPESVELEPEPTTITEPPALPDVSLSAHPVAAVAATPPEPAAAVLPAAPVAAASPARPIGRVAALPVRPALATPALAPPSRPTVRLSRRLEPAPAALARRPDPPLWTPAAPARRSILRRAAAAILRPWQDDPDRPGLETKPLASADGAGANPPATARATPSAATPVPLPVTSHLEPTPVVGEPPAATAPAVGPESRAESFPDPAAPSEGPPNAASTDDPVSASEPPTTVDQPSSPPAATSSPASARPTLARVPATAAPTVRSALDVRVDDPGYRPAVVPGPDPAQPPLDDDRLLEAPLPTADSDAGGDAMVADDLGAPHQVAPVRGQRVPVRVVGRQAAGIAATPRRVGPGVVARRPAPSRGVALAALADPEAADLYAAFARDRSRAPAAVAAPTTGARPALMRDEAPPPVPPAEPAAPAAPSAAPAPAAAAPGPAAPDHDLLYEEIVRRLRRELLVERERHGDLLGGLP